MTAERRALKMHPKMLWDVIHRQAGSVSKAILEGVMNSVDAGATRCDVTIDRDGFTIRDDGKGFANDQEIEDFFETFGHPHEEGDARYGRFRMGRGQMMAFGKNTWTTNGYRLEVDLKPQKDASGKDWALGYDFHRTADKVKGCHIEVDLYDKLSPSQLDGMLREITDYVKFVDIPVTLNGKVISVDPTKQKWDYETPDAYIKRRDGGTLDVYNQGVLVSKYSSYRFGVSGVVVSKEALEVNFARNDVIASCSRWKRIIKVLNEEALSRAKRAPLDDAQREMFASQLAAGELTIEELSDARIVTDVTGSHHPVTALTRLKNNYSGQISIAPRGDRVAEMAHTRKLAFVVSSECAARFRCDTPKEFAAMIERVFAANGVRHQPFKAVERAAFDEVISSSHEPVKDGELSKAERLALKALRDANRVLYQQASWYDASYDWDKFQRGRDGIRKVSVGVSDTALAWTDGVSNIWFDRRQLRKIKEGYDGMIQLAGILLHEYLHNGPDTGTHEHGVEFYERFHDIALRTQTIPLAAAAMMRTVLRELRSEDKHIQSKLTAFEDTATEAADLGLGSYSTDADDGFVPDVSGVEDEAPVKHAAMAADPQPSPASRPSPKRRRKEDDGSQLALGF